ncbi:hypothetical protein BH24ACI3_BH24ACI3_00290 [soil metagenome]
MNNQAGTQQQGIMTGLFRDKESSERAYQSLRDRGYTEDEINVMMSDKTRDTYYGEGAPESELGTKALEGTGVGAAVGGTLGAIIGGVAAIGTNVILPGLGLVVAGPLAAALAGAGAGGALGSLSGALIGWGIPEERAEIYESGIKDGGTVIGVTPRSNEDSDYFEKEWTSYNGESIYR